MSAAEIVETEVEPVEEPVEGDEGEGGDAESDQAAEGATSAPDEFSLNTEEEATRLRLLDKSLEKENARHERSLEALHADAWEAYCMCPLCIGEGFLLPYGPGELPGEQLDAIDALAGRYAAPEYIVDDSYVMCDKCDGQGRNVTGSKVPEHLTKLCDDCQGNGFKKKLYVPAPVTQLPVPGSAGAINAQPPVTYGAPGAADQWGRPQGHAHYGIEPQFVTA